VTTATCKLISCKELEDRRQEGLRRGDEFVFLEPGMMWFMSWVWDHQDPDLEQYLPGMIRHGPQGSGATSLSMQYLTEWATIRDPLAIVLPTPNFTMCYPDSNQYPGKGWTVTGVAPRISLSRHLIVGTSYTGTIMEGVIALSKRSSTQTPDR
jgi:hypothetical protein